MAAARKPARKKNTSRKSSKSKSKTTARKSNAAPGRAGKTSGAAGQRSASARATKISAGRSPARKKSARKKAIPGVVPTGRYRSGRPPTPAGSGAAAHRHAPDPDAHEEYPDREDRVEYEEPGYDHLPDPHAELDEERDAYMSVGEHLEELRVRIFWMIGVIAGLAAVAGFFSGTLHDYLVAPYSALTDQNLILQNVYGPMEIFIKVSVLAAVIVGFPALVFILWGFVTPAVSRRTALYGHLAVAGSALLFWTGIAVCWLYILPLSLRFFFVGMQMDGVDPVLSVERYYGFIFALHLATGLAFQLPIVLIALGAFGILTVAWHKKTWRFALVVIYISSALITPPDPWSMLGVGTLLSLLYLLSIGVVWLIERSRK